MATTENEYYLRSILMLAEGGSYISKKVLYRELSGDLDTLLKSYKSKLKHELHEKQLEKLFPSHGKTVVDTWDLQMLIIVVLRLFHTSLKQEDKKNLRVIKMLRHEVQTHICNPGRTLDDEQYDNIKGQLTDALTSLASGFDGDVQTECRSYITKYASAPLEVTSARECLKQLHENDVLFKQVLEMVENDIYAASPQIAEKTLIERLVKPDIGTCREKKEDYTAVDKVAVVSTSSKKRQADVGQLSPPCESETVPKKPALAPGLQLSLPEGVGETNEEAHAGDNDKTKGSNEAEGLLHAVDDTEMFQGLGETELLDSAELNKLCSSEGRTSSNVKKECEKICVAIKAESDQIVHVFSAYKLYDEASIVFVVFAEKEMLLDLPWTLELRVVHQYSEESEIVMYCKDNSRLSTEISRTIEDVIDKYSVKLMHIHTYLSAISASSVVSKHYGTTHHNIVSEPCIVLSVLVKHFIPLNEEPFPTKLDGITVDVREGGFRFCGSSADDFHDHVRMGCKITSSFLPQKFGTLGGFVEHPEYGLCGFTCTHAILNDEKKQEVKGKGNVKGKELGLCEIFQPSCAPQNKIGRVVEVTYKEGNDGKTGIDVALFKIEQRPPAEGNFPDSQGTTTQVKFESGRVWGKEGIPTHQPMVHKFGFVTGLTSGQIQFDGAVVKEILFHSKMETGTLDLTTTLYKQYHIKSNDRNVRFSELGDSGALVFMSDGFDQEDDLRCIGMVEGIWNDNTCAVTPITAILEELKVTQLKSFTPIVTWKKIDARLSEMEERIMRAIARGNTNAHNSSQ